MKKQRRYKSKDLPFFERLGINVISIVVVTLVTATLGWAWNLNSKVVTLETALASLTTDVHDIKAFLLKTQ